MRLPRFLNFEKIVTFLNRLSPRERVFLVGAVAMGVLVFSDHLVVRPLVKTFGSLEQQLADLHRDIKKSVKLLSQKNRIMNEVHGYSTYTLRAKSPEEETVELLKLIQELANKADVNLLYVKPAPVKSAAGEKDNVYATLESEATMEQVINFFYLVESSQQLLKIEKYSIQPVAKGSRVAKCAATISRPLFR